MASYSAEKLKKKNQEEVNMIAAWLRQAPKVALQAAVLRAHSEVMQSAHLNGSMIHDSSNAAFNWRVVVGGSATETNYKGIAPVGESGDSRTANSDTGSIIATITTRLHQDASLLDQAIWGGMKSSNVKLVNPIRGYYAENARLNEASSSWQAQAEGAADSALNRWQAAGPKVDWSRYGKEWV